MRYDRPIWYPYEPESSIIRMISKREKERVIAWGERGHEPNQRTLVYREASKEDRQCETKPAGQAPSDSGE